MSKVTNLALPDALLAEARALGLDAAQICERVLRNEIALVRTAQWREDHRQALMSSNNYVERNGLPLEKFRQF